MKKFGSYSEYENWAQTFENCADYEEIPVVIDDGRKISADMFTACKRYKTALRRFEKTFKEVNGEIPAWLECMRESCESGYFKDRTPAEWENGTYSWGVEETSEGYWYIFLNISGIYAGREAT